MATDDRFTEDFRETREDEVLGTIAEVVTGPVADWAHFHELALQIIYVRSGWVRVVYEEQGPPFVMEAGDLVLQPPGIRHRVLESSAGLEVIEISCPAMHETLTDHEMQLPNRTKPSRRFGRQRFLRHVAANAVALTRDVHEQGLGLTAHFGRKCVHLRSVCPGGEVGIASVCEDAT